VTPCKQVFEVLFLTLNLAAMILWLRFVNDSGRVRLRWPPVCDTGSLSMLCGRGSRDPPTRPRPYLSCAFFRIPGHVHCECHHLPRHVRAAGQVLPSVQRGGRNRPAGGLEDFQVRASGYHACLFISLRTRAGSPLSAPGSPLTRHPHLRSLLRPGNAGFCPFPRR
jgi:hypothetical protein